MENRKRKPNEDEEAKATKRARKNQIKLASIDEKIKSLNLLVANCLEYKVALLSENACFRNQIKALHDELDPRSASNTPMDEREAKLNKIKELCLNESKNNLRLKKVNLAKTKANDIISQLSYGKQLKIDKITSELKTIIDSYEEYKLNSPPKKSATVEVIQKRKEPDNGAEETAAEKPEKRSKITYDENKENKLLKTLEPLVAKCLEYSHALSVENESIRSELRTLNRELFSQRALDHLTEKDAQSKFDKLKDLSLRESNNTLRLNKINTLIKKGKTKIDKIKSNKKVQLLQTEQLISELKKLYDEYKPSSISNASEVVQPEVVQQGPQSVFATPAVLFSTTQQQPSTPNSLGPNTQQDEQQIDYDELEKVLNDFHTDLHGYNNSSTGP